MARIKPKQLLIQSKTKKSPSRISYSSIITWNLIVVLVVLSLYATYRHWHHRPSFEAEMDLPLDENVERSEDSTKISTPNYAVMDTAKGSITIEIYKDASAGVVDRFVKLCKTDYFKGMPFRHVIKNFVIQGGDFDFNGAAQEWILKAKASGENTLSPKHEAFMIGTTKSPNSKGFDIFITTAPIPDLNDKIVVFGRVIKGEDIVQDAATGVGFRLLDGLTILLLLHLLAVVATHAVAAAAMMLLLPSPLSTALLQNTMVKLIYVYTVYTPQNHITNTHKQRN